MPTPLKGRSVLSINDFSSQEINQLLEATRFMKQKGSSGGREPFLSGKCVGMIFQKPSTRTRVSFEIAMNHLGGHALYLSANELQLKRGETVPDTARTLSRYLDGIVARVYQHKDLIALTNSASIPVINALSDFEHPCQALADIFTIYEKKKTFKDIKIAYLGDGNNVCHSLVLAVAKVGAHISIATPPDYAPSAEVITEAKTVAKTTGAIVETMTVPEEAVQHAHFVYTDVWTSMGQEEEREKRLKAFQGYQINSTLLKQAQHDVLVMHCLPAHRDEEITDEVMEGPHSIVFDQAENRLHVQKALLVQILK